MKRLDYLKEIESRISKLSAEAIDDALSYYEEILDERNIGIDDEVPKDMPSARQASFEILRDANIDILEEEDRNKKGRKGASLIGTIILAILALPLGLPLTIAVAAVVFAFVVAFGAVTFGLLMASGASIVASLYDIFTQPFEIARFIYLVGIICIAIAVALLVYSAAKGLFNFIKRKLIERRKNKELKNENNY